MGHAIHVNKTENYKFPFQLFKKLHESQYGLHELSFFNHQKVLF